MSDKQAAVTYRRVTRSANGFAIMKKQHLSSFVAGQGTLVPCGCRSMYFHVFVDKLSNKLLWLFCLFVIFPMKLHFLRNELKRFASGAILSFAEKISASFQF